VNFVASALDVVDGDVSTTCSADSGSTFALGTTTVVCEATDAAGNTATKSFAVKVEDTTAPSMTVSEDVVAEAVDADGALVEYDEATATDIVDGKVQPHCSAASGSLFALGKTTVTCSATDAAGNPASKSFVVDVVDTTDPVVTAPANLVVGNTSPTGADHVKYGVASAHDAVSGNLTVTCSPGPETSFPLGVTTVTCSATDAAGNTGESTFTVEVQDWTKPEVAVPADVVAEATGPTGATVTFAEPTATDDVDGAVQATCTAASGSEFPLGATTVSCSARDSAGNEGTNSFTVTVMDTTAPVFGAVANKTVSATSAGGAAVSFATPTAADLVDGAVTATCDRASGSLFALGTTTVSCRATDQAGNSSSKTFTVTVTAAWSGFLQPINVDGSSVFKQGSTVPVKFQLTGASAGIKDLTARLYLQRTGVTASGTVMEAISTSNATTGSLFRYDTTGDQYIFNLATKNLSVGTYKLMVDVGDGVARTVNISLK
jgi:hypothetical protein